jgi:hypothetical protein
MSLANSTIVDAVGIENETGSVVLTIADSWDWFEEHDHLLALQSKLDAYFEFVESGQVWDVYPAARGRQLVIDVVSKFSPPKAALEFMEKVTLVASRLNVRIRQRRFQGTMDAEK